jgi:hypothetical protein
VEVVVRFYGPAEEVAILPEQVELVVVVEAVLTE